jgi:LPXTG-motif cell wall-anchored protein
VRVFDRQSGYPCAAATGRRAHGVWSFPRSIDRVLAIIAILLIIWLVVTVLGAVIKGLFWLAIIGGLLFLATAAYGAVKRRNNPSIR